MIEIPSIPFSQRITFLRAAGTQKPLHSITVAFENSRYTFRAGALSEIHTLLALFRMKQANVHGTDLFDTIYPGQRIWHGD